MSRVDKKRRKVLLQVREKRKAKLAKLRQKYVAAKTGNEKEKALEKARKVAPWLSQEEFLAPAKSD